MSPALGEEAGQRVGIRLQVDSHAEAGLLSAQVQLVEAASPAYSGGRSALQVRDRSEYGVEMQRALDGHHVPDLWISGLAAAHATIPLVIDCNRVLAELAADEEAAANFVEIPIAPAPI